MRSLARRPRFLWILPALFLLGGPLARAAEVVVLFGVPGRVTAGDTVQLSWTGLPAGTDEVELELSLDGREWVRISPQLEASEHSWSWRVPLVAARQARIRLRMGGEEDGEEHEVVAALSRTFAIEGAAAIPGEEDADAWRWSSADASGGSLAANLPPLSNRHHRFPVRVRTGQSLSAPVAGIRLPLPAPGPAPAPGHETAAHPAPRMVPLRN